VAPTRWFLLCVLAMGLPASASAAQRQITVEPSAGQVKRLEKIEFTLAVAAVGENPYDPAEIDLSIEFTSPSGKKVTAAAFYFQPFERREMKQGGRKAEWLYPVGAAVWKVRFAPAEVGKYTGVARLKDRAGAAASGPVALESVASAAKGFVRVSAKDPRYLEFDDGTPYFAVGQNVAFVKDSYDTAEMIRRLGESGANFARVWACGQDWAMAIEARKSAWGRSWGGKPPFAPMPDGDGSPAAKQCVKLSGEAGARATIQPCYAVALKPNTKYRFSCAVRAEGGAAVALDLAGPRTIEAKPAWTPFALEFTAGADQWWLGQPTFRLTAAGTAYLKDFSLKEATGGPELLWEADANRPVLGVYNQTDCFMLDKVLEAAEQAGVRLELTMLTRDLYMSKLANESGADYDACIAYGKRLVRYYVARWGYSTHVAMWEYFNEMDPGKPTNRFYAELGDYLAQIDPYRHLRSTSTWSSPSKDYRHPKLDTADLHYYMRPADKDLFKDAAAAVQARWKAMQPHVQGRPLVFAEFGLADDKWGLSPEIGKDKEYTFLHNALWASALTGFAGTVCPWWWEDIHKKDMYHHYKPVAAYAADIPFTAAGLQPSSATCDKGMRAVGLQGDGRAYVWISDPGATWWRIAMESAVPAEVKGATLTVEGLKPGPYAVQWWDTREGKIVKQDAAKAAAGAALKLAVPPFSRDIACKVLAGG